MARPGGRARAALVWHDAGRRRRPAADGAPLHGPLRRHAGQPRVAARGRECAARRAAVRPGVRARRRVAVQV